MKSLIFYADPFWGTDVVALPKPSGLAATWYPIKAMLGANDPGAAIPFGKLTCSPYTGGYSSGYGKRDVTYGGEVKDFEPEMLFRGVSHIHNEGTGFLGKFFNYFVTTPYLGDTPIPRSFVCEKAYPGYYACTLSDGVFCELTVGEKGAVHRYTYPSDGGRIKIDVSNDGLSKDLSVNTRGIAQNSFLEAKSDNLATAKVTLQGVTYYAAFRCNNSNGCSLYSGDTILSGKTAYISKSDEPFGFVFEVTGRSCEVTVTLTTMNEATALAQLSTLNDFDAVLTLARQKWEDSFQKIEITADEYDKKVFASAYYHSIIKPTDWSGEGFLGIEGDCILDLSTLWDMYKTQIPLLLTLFPQIGQKLLNTFLSVFKRWNHFPNTLTLTSEQTIENQQARALTELVIADAYYRGIGDAKMFAALLAAAEKDLFRAENRDFFENGNCEYATHVLDLAEACRSIGQVAAAEGNKQLSEKLFKYCENWRKAFGNDGMMRENSPYYEGTRYNYSFRLLSNMEERIALCGKDRFIEYLDRFFGFTHPNDISARFEGFNNETDMEAPYAYHYAGRHDRLCEILDAQRRYCFAPGRGGAPGNVDSGAISSCYIWNCLGVFPVSGQNTMILGAPAFENAKLHLPGGTLEIIREGNGIYVKEISFNGKKVPNREITVTDFQKGGKLIFTMSENPVF
ncbi:MAG: glycoside hydrolase domain-containing protein [Acutalibacteraceae bacterium]|jgi:putative alpha-1,2-mannosidase